MKLFILATGLVLAYQNCLSAGQVSIAVDDGPVLVYSQTILDDLYAAQKTAAFFLQMDNMTNPDVQAIAINIKNNGHLAALRAGASWSGDLRGMNEEQIRNLVEPDMDVFYSIFGTYPSMVRLTEGTFDADIEAIFKNKLGMELMSWNYDMRGRDPSSIYNLNLSESYIILSGTNEQDATGFDGLLAALTDKGFSIVDMSTCTGVPPTGVGYNPPVETKDNEDPKDKENPKDKEGENTEPQPLPGVNSDPPTGDSAETSDAADTALKFISFIGAGLGLVL